MEESEKSMDVYFVFGSDTGKLSVKNEFNLYFGMYGNFK